MPIPFEPQQAIDGSRTCGAAALAMVYRSLGLPGWQSAIWQRIAQPLPSGVKAARTHRLALDACGQGLAAVTLQAQEPDRLLDRLLGRQSRVIVSHRLQRNSALGHYSVLVGLEDRQVVLHDPHLGPQRRLPWAEFLELWNPCGEGLSEVVGQVLVAIGPRPAEEQFCSACGARLPQARTCARCGGSVSTGPSGAVENCPAGCPDPLWRRLFCPHCDWAVSNRGAR